MTQVTKNLGEVALRVSNMANMVRFYRDVVQLKLMREEAHMAFFEISAGYKGHTNILALFKREGDVTVEQSTLDHLAFSIDLKDFQSEKKRLEDLGLQVRVEQHNWVQWRGLYISDPEGNTIEFVCFDDSIPKNFES